MSGSTETPETRNLKATTTVCNDWKFKFDVPKDGAAGFARRALAKGYSTRGAMKQGITAAQAQAWEAECGLQEGHDLTLRMELSSPGKDIHEWITTGGAADSTWSDAKKKRGGKRKQAAPELVERILDPTTHPKLNPKIFTDEVPDCCHTLNVLIKIRLAHFDLNAIVTSFQIPRNTIEQLGQWKI